MTGPAREEGRAALVERLTETIQAAGVADVVVDRAPALAVDAGDVAEAVLAALEAEAAADVEAYAASLVEGLRPGLDLFPPHELVTVMAASLAERLGAAKSYDETTVSMEVHAAGDREWYVLTVQRKSGKTPHQLRLEAEAQRNEARDEAEKLSARLEARERVLTGERDQARAEAGRAVCRAVAAEAEVARLRALLHEIAVAQRGDHPDVDIEPDELPDEIRANHRAWAREHEKVEVLLDARRMVLAIARGEEHGEGRWEV